MYRGGLEFEGGALLYIALAFVILLMASLFLVLFKTFAPRSQGNFAVMVGIFLYFSISSIIASFFLSVMMGIISMVIYGVTAVVMFRLKKRHPDFEVT